MSKTPSLAARATAAVLLMVGFYALAILIAGALFAIPVAEYEYAHRIDFRPAIFCLVGGFAILRSIVPRPDRFDAPGPELEADTQPRLWGAIEGVARATGQVMPSEVYLVPDVNAWVAQRGGVMGLGSRRVMGLGLPLLQTVTVDELRAILAHEFGHYHGGDTALGPWIYKTRAAIGRTLQSLARHSSMLMKPFEWYGIGFLRITHAISRQQEYAADALAARTVGAAPMMSGLRAVHGTGAVFGQYWATEVGPLVERGYRPPIAAGFTHFLSTPEVAPAVTALIEREIATPTIDPYDTHPPLRDRLSALEAHDVSAATVSTSTAMGPLAITLLDDVDALETRLVRHLYTAATARPLTAIEWQQAGAEVWSTIWRDDLRKAGGALDGVLAGEVPRLAADLPAAAARLGFAPNRGSADQRSTSAVVHVLGVALSVALLDRGWSVSALPGEVVVFSKDGDTLTPFADIMRLSARKLERADWRAAWERTGILDVDLGSLRGKAATASFLKPG